MQLFAAALLLAGAGAAPLEVHIVPHSHCDVGWLETVDAYYDSIVGSALTTITRALAADPTRRFVWSEIKWLQMWWPAADEEARELLRAAVRSGQFEFVGAGWSQNDEVTPTYSDVIDNQVPTSAMRSAHARPRPPRPRRGFSAPTDR